LQLKLIFREQIANCHVFMPISSLNYHVVKSKLPLVGHLVACNYSKCNRKCSCKLGSHKPSSMGMDEKFWPSFNVCNYTLNFVAMSCLFQLTILWHLSKATRVFLIACVHYNYKWVANSIIDFQFFSSDWQHECCFLKKMFSFFHPWYGYQGLAMICMLPYKIQFENEFISTVQ